MEQSLPARPTTMDPIDAAAWAAVLPAGVVVQEGDPPPAPSTFGQGYVLPVHSEKPLQAISAHPLDADLSFEEKSHVYSFRGRPLSISTTALAHAFEKEFVAADAIQLMKTSRRQPWPRKAYVVGAAPVGAWTPDRGALLVADGCTVSAAHPRSLDRSDLPALFAFLDRVAVKGSTVRCADAAEAGSGVELLSYEREMTPDEIARGWKEKGEEASHRGTEAHYQAELAANGLPFRWWEPEGAIFLRFLREHVAPRGLKVWATEKEVVCRDADMGGSIDLILYDPATGLHHVVDHKRSDKLRKDLRGYGKMSAPFAHLDDCKGAGYGLQTSIYQYVLERDYGLKVGERVLLSLHPDAPFCTAVPYLRREVEYIMEDRMATVAAREAAAADEPRFRCCLSGAPTADAVRVEAGEHAGKLAMEKAALLAGVACSPDAEAREEFALCVSLLKKEVPVPTRKEVVPWRELVPEEGIVPFA